MESNGKMTLSELEQFLWGAANILRGPVDASNFKAYIFPLLFFKRISDIFDEEYQSALKESGGDEEYALYPENHSFMIPGGASRKDGIKLVEPSENLCSAYLKMAKESLISMNANIDAGVKRWAIVAAYYTRYH